MAKKTKDPVQEKDERFPLPEYPAKDDIYNKEKEIALEQDEDTGKIATEKKQKSGDMNLDIPGAEADDQDEFVGEEDEENNYYSLGGDNHQEQEENTGDQ